VVRLQLLDKVLEPTSRRAPACNMPKKTPEMTFAGFFNMANDPAASQTERDKANREMAAWLRRRGKTTRDIQAILVKAAEDEKAHNPPPPPPDPRKDASVRYDPERHNPASIVEALLKTYVTMPEYARVIYSLAICLTHVYTRFSIAPRVTLVSRLAFSGKSIALEVGARLAFNPNQEAMGTGAAIEEHFMSGPCSLFLDEAQYFDPDAKRRLRRIWNQGHVDDRGSKFSKMVAGKKRPVSYFGLVFLAGVGKGIGRLLASQEQSRTLRLELQRYTKETMPPRNYRIKEEVDVEAFKAAYSLLCAWASKAKLNPKPPMPPELIARDADNFRGLLAVADDCGGEWPRRAREALMVLFEQQRAEDPVTVILRHSLVVIDEVLGGQERFKPAELDKELRRLDKPGMDWNRYRGLGGDENEHPITARERADLLREAGIETEAMKPLGGGKTFRGVMRSWFVEALRRRESSTPDDAGPERGRLRLITPALGFGLAASPILVTAFSQVPDPVVGAGLPGLVVVGSALLALARRRRRQCALPAADDPAG
jgi:uncharacterized protein DUF3631